MATSGSAIDAFSTRGNYILRLTVSLHSTSGQQTRWSWVLDAYRVEGSFSDSFDNNPIPWSLNVEGDATSGSRGLSFVGTNGPITISTGTTGWKTHSDGYLTVNFSASMGASPVFGSASLSGSFSANRIAQVPDAPPAPVFKSATSTTLTFTIAQPTDNGGASVIDYTMQVLANDGVTLVEQWVSGNSTQTSPSTLSPNTPYKVRYRARNSVGSSAWTSLVTMTTTTRPPAAPTSPAILNLAPTSMDVDWVAPTDIGGAAITGYKVQRATNSTFTQDMVEFTTGTTSLFNATGLEPSKTYYWRIAATNSAGTGAWSTTVSGTTVSGMNYSTGTQWQAVGVFVSDGATWEAAEVFVSNGTAWIGAI